MTTRRASEGRRTKPRELPKRVAESQRDQFLALSVTLTGFDSAELHGTGMLDTYYALIPSIAGEPIFGDLLTCWRNIATRGSGKRSLIERLVAEEMFDDPDLGPLARNLALLWYTGSWFQLPGAWRNAHGASARDLTHVVSTKSYTEGLVWPAMNTHPQAAKQPGYASWAIKPKGA